MLYLFFLRKGYFPFVPEVFVRLQLASHTGEKAFRGKWNKNICFLRCGGHTRGKQTLNRGGMFYTAQSGIWQSVWYEWVRHFPLRMQ